MGRILSDSDAKAQRQGNQEAMSSFQQFTAERFELMIVIILMAFMVSVIDETFRLITYAIIVAAIFLVGYNFYMGMQNPPGPGEEEQEILLDNSK